MVSGQCPSEKIFSKYNLELGKHYFVDTDRINLSGFDKWDKIIAISEYDNGDFEDYYTIYEMWKLSCNNENKLNIENKSVYKRYRNNHYQNNDVVDVFF